MTLALPKPDLDATDLAILSELAVNARMPFAEIGRRVGLSQPAMSERVKRLEDRGIIAGYRVIVDLDRIGLGLTAIIRLATDHSRINPCMEKLRSLRGVTEILRTTGEDCLHIRVTLRNTRELEQVVDAVARFGLVRTSVVLSREGFDYPDFDQR
ncbi:AsnC family transcriptional regulator [Primorskyibacter flagellatus]|uniref:AsnC family transcriptional regulator n=1 Tax=Primorskyibacter flagellatus TaxID=1387277 RepID=A0A917ADM7_9RHOB|nr:Lrp/AsnC family transcriptional regulator [Primorskyibacter flagellatus]GGE45236.1 AsnC family transcriptional regulator [Primorskyibacter flagellatus]